MTRASQTCWNAPTIDVLLSSGGGTAWLATSRSWRYDLLGRETAFIRGTLSASGNNSGSDGPLDTVSTINSSAGSHQAYTLDALGNRIDYVTAAGSASLSTTCNTFNNQNEETSIGGYCGISYDNDGEKTCQCGCGTYAYDAWDDEVAACACSTGGGASCYVYQTAAYDAEARQISDDVTTVDYCSSGAYACTVNTIDNPAEYYDQRGQVVEDLANYCTTSVNRFTCSEAAVAAKDLQQLLGVPMAEAWVLNELLD
jgi:hypothetical protein